jgi:hypothetical protein
MQLLDSLRDYGIAGKEQAGAPSEARPTSIETIEPHSVTKLLDE